MTDSVDINMLIKKGAVTIAPVEHEDDRAARINRENLEHRFNLYKEVGLTATVLFVLVALTLASLHTMIIAKTPTVDASQWARTSLLAIAGSVVTFLLARAKK